MAKLSKLTDYYEPETLDSLPVDNPYVPVADPTRRVPVFTSEEVKPKEEDVLDTNTMPSKTSVVVDKILNKLFRDDDQRYQLWPEKLVREALTGAGDVASGKVPTWSIDPASGEVHTSPQMVEKAQAISALAGSGGLAGGAEGTVLNATPSLRPALKYKDRLYKGKEGQQHMDVIPEALYPEFQKMAMSGEDISHYNFGFVNDKGHFLDREAALKYAVDTGMVDKFAGQYGALTSTLLADSSKPGMAVEAMAKANPFFSAVEHNVSKIPQSKMTGDQWLGTLANKPGVKPEELDWTGLKSFLEENKGKPVTKQQIEEHLASNKVELKEVNKFQNENGELAPKHETKYSQYVLPGAEPNSYREMLLTLPNKKSARIDELDNQIKQLYDRKPRGSANFATAEDNRLFGDLTAERNKLLKQENSYKSSHWDEPNILAHVRMNDRDVGGKKSLHLEEIQSDWHQQGRDKGYRPQKEKELADLVEQRGKLQEEASVLASSDPRYKEIYKELPKIQNRINELGSSSTGVPDAPFKKTWHELALKRMIREAAEKGYDRLSWTPGEAQAARYDLSKQISDLNYNPKTKMLRANDKNNNTVLNTHVEPDKISDYVGKEAAKKLLDTPYDPKNPYSSHSLLNADLKIGGEGMKGFYDQIIPKALEKLGKEHGVKVKQIALKDAPTYEIKKLRTNKDGIEIYGVYKNDGTFMADMPKSDALQYVKDMEKAYKPPMAHYIDLPQSLKDQALGKGFPLFSNRYMFTPVDYEPEFKK